MSSFGAGLPNTLLMRLMEHDRFLKQQQAAQEQQQLAMGMQQMYDAAKYNREQEQHKQNMSLEMAAAQGKYAQQLGQALPEFQSPEASEMAQLGAMETSAARQAKEENLQRQMRVMREQERLLGLRSKAEGRDPIQDYRSKRLIDKQLGVGAFAGRMSGGGTPQEVAFDKQIASVIDDIGESAKSLTGLGGQQQLMQAAVDLQRQLSSLRVASLPVEEKTRLLQQIMAEYSQLPLKSMGTFPGLQTPMPWQQPPPQAPQSVAPPMQAPTPMPQPQAPPPQQGAGVDQEASGLADYIGNLRKQFAQ